MSPRQIVRKAALSKATDGIADCGRSSYSRYQQGCRCAACRRSNAEYARRYAQKSRAAVKEAARRVAAEEAERRAERAKRMQERLESELGI